MLSFELDKSNKFQFSMEIFGDNDTGASPIVEFKIKTGTTAFSFPATLLENSVYEVNVPALGQMLKPGSYTTEVVVILGDRYFVPLTENIEVRTPIKPVVSNFRANNAAVAAPKVNVEFVRAPSPPMKEEKVVVSAFQQQPPLHTPEPVKAAPVVEAPVVHAVEAPAVKQEVKKPVVKDPLMADFLSFSKKKK